MTGDKLSHTVAFSPDDRFIALGGRDAKVRILDAASGSVVLVLEAHEDAVRDSVTALMAQWLPVWPMMSRLGFGMLPQANCFIPIAAMCLRCSRWIFLRTERPLSAAVTIGKLRFGASQRPHEESVFNPWGRSGAVFFAFFALKRSANCKSCFWIHWRVSTLCLRVQ